MSVVTLLRFLAAALLCLGSVAAAVDHPEPARRLALRTSGPSLAWTVKSPVPPPATGPNAVGATLYVSGESAESASLDLPASGWTVDGTGTTFRYANPLAPGGPSPVKRARLSAQKVLRVVASSTGITLDEATQGTMYIALTIGSDTYCSTCTAPSRDEVGRYIARLCAAPVSCVPPSTTTTTTSSTTTSTAFVPNICGNGVIDQPGEECDPPDTGMCPIPPLMCDAPSSPTPCTCCHAPGCTIQAGGTIPCCGGAQCQDIQGFGTMRQGVCVPPSCDEDADCNGYQCVGGTCCEPTLGDLCGVVTCCPGSGGTCTVIPGMGVFCCRAPGSPCSGASDYCCSGSCTASVCD